MDGGGGDDDGNLMTMLVELLHARKLEKLEEILKEPRLEPHLVYPSHNPRLDDEEDLKWNSSYYLFLVVALPYGKR